MRVLIMMVVVFGLVGCASQGSRELEAVASVDLERFMGDWYVLAAIPTFLERQAFNAVESYRLDDDGTIDTTFTFNKGGFGGPLKTYNPRGFVRQGSNNAIWGMRFIWPIKSDFRIIHLDPDYQTTVIGRQKRDFVWIMARHPQVDDDTWQRLETVVAGAGYDPSRLRRVPHRPLDNGVSR